MKDVNVCNGCFYAGVKNGCKPECICELRSKYEEEYEEQKTEDVSLGNRKTSYQRHIERRRNKAKANQKARDAFKFAEARANKLSGNATYEEWKREEKKCKNMDKKAKRNKQVTIILSLPATIGRTQSGSISKLESWMSSTPAIANECKEAIETLELARKAGGEAVASFREGLELHVTIGFYCKKELENFKRKYETVAS